MGKPVVTAENQITCSHGSPAKSVKPNPKVLVGGQPVLTCMPQVVVSGCPNQVGPAKVPCTTGVWNPGSTSQKVFVGGDPVVLASSAAIVMPLGMGVIIPPGQVKVMAT